MDQQLYLKFREIIYRNSGIVLSQDKIPLLSGRIQKSLRKRGLSSEEQYLEIIESDATGEELKGLLNSISTNTTYFWREPEHFDKFAELLAGWKKQGRKKIRVWCAAASSGQEPYTLAIKMHQVMPPGNFDCKLLATDISTKVLNIALEAKYTNEDISRLPTDIQQRYFEAVESDPKAPYMSKLVNEVRQMVLFKRLNLIDVPYPIKGPLDVIFCRNVMIYFDQPVRQKIISEFERVMAPGGYLFLSHSESLLGIQHKLERGGTSIFIKGGAR